MIKMENQVLIMIVFILNFLIFYLIQIHLILDVNYYEFNNLLEFKRIGNSMDLVIR